LVAALLSVGIFTPSGRPDGPGNDPKMVEARSSLVKPAAASESEQAIARLMMSDADKDKVRAEVARGKVRLGWITVSDIQQEDGDWVRLEAAGFRQDVRLLHRPYTVAVPYLPGSVITVTGLVDGGGGNVTVAVYVGSVQVSLKPLAKGETLQIPAP